VAAIDLTILAKTRHPHVTLAVKLIAPRLALR
jgi:hypothetical protein